MEKSNVFVHHFGLFLKVHISQNFCHDLNIFVIGFYVSGTLFDEEVYQKHQWVGFRFIHNGHPIIGDFLPDW